MSMKKRYPAWLWEGSQLYVKCRHCGRWLNISQYLEDPIREYQCSRCRKRLKVDRVNQPRRNMKKPIPLGTGGDRVSMSEATKGGLKFLVFGVLMIAIGYMAYGSSREIGGAFVVVGVFSVIISLTYFGILTQ